MTTLIYGGLSSFGLYVTDRFLNEGQSVVALSDAATAEEETQELTNELYVGRNAQFMYFEQVRDLQDVGEKVTTLISLNKTSLNGEVRQVNVDDEKQTLEKIFTTCPNLTKVILLSSLDVYGISEFYKINEESETEPETRWGRYVSDCEAIYQQKIKEEEGIELIILRLPVVLEANEFWLIQAKETLLERLGKFSNPDILHIHDAIEGIWRAFQMSNRSEISIYQLTSGKPFFKARDQPLSFKFKVYPCQKAFKDLGFHPIYTLQRLKK